MSNANIQDALELALNSLTPAILTAWPNVSIEPGSLELYQRADTLFAEPSNPTIGDGFYRELGYMQVTLYYPVQAGSRAAVTRAEMIRTLFKRGSTFTNGGIDVKIPRKPSLSLGNPQDGRYTVIVKIPFYADIFE